MSLRLCLRLLGLCAALLITPALAAAADDENHLHCDNCDEWNEPQAPFNIFGNTWYVGTGGLSAILVTGPEGHVLLDGALPQSAAQIQANIEALGFRIGDVKLIVNSHEHFDHAGGIAALQRASGATVAASAAGRARAAPGHAGQRRSAVRRQVTGAYPESGQGQRSRRRPDAEGRHTSP